MSVNPSKFLGTPLTNHDVDQARGIKYSRSGDKKFDVIAQVRQLRRGEKEKFSMHGAFTGGFASGYHNTVGSKEGWMPKSFSSSRTSKSEHLIQKTEDFMDDEDNASILNISNDFSQSTDELDKILGIDSNSLGLQLLSKFKWIFKISKSQKKRLIGPQLPSNFETHTNKLFIRKKGDFSGIGYNRKTILTRLNNKFDDYGGNGLGYFRMGLDDELPLIEDINNRLDYRMEFVEVNDEDNSYESLLISVPNSFSGKHIDDSEEDFKKMIKIMGEWRPLEEAQPDQANLGLDGLDEIQKLQHLYSKLIPAINFIKQGECVNTKSEKRGGRSAIAFIFDHLLLKRFKISNAESSKRQSINKDKQEELIHIRFESNAKNKDFESENESTVDNAKAIPPRDIFKAVFGGDSDSDT